MGRFAALMPFVELFQVGSITIPEQRGTDEHAPFQVHDGQQEKATQHCGGQKSASKCVHQKIFRPLGGGVNKR